jgi:hypothetical protein
MNALERTHAVLPAPETETQKLEALKTHKKSLMQQLFPPSPEESEA